MTQAVFLGVKKRIASTPNSERNVEPSDWLQSVKDKMRLISRSIIPPFPDEKI